ncbi:MAG TPA: HAMP domain-containing sensor histidine kinase [Elusimicrobiales bacterium]|nr:HAMP domain-containing sensor histidine kinase [Elusimicrobiales bacterium]
MSEEKLPTKFLPAEKAAPAELERHRRLFLESPAITGVLDGMLNFSMVLNRQRQAVFVNKSFLDFIKEHGIKDPVGQRPGELAGCVHAAETTGGCGTTASCRYCGAGQALAAALGGTGAVKECRILSKKSGDDLDLRVQVIPFKYNNEDLLLISMMDISSEKRRQVLERLFFHDILNTAGGVQGLIGLMVDTHPAEAHTYVPAASEASDRMVAQILSQKDLAAAERGDLQVKNSEFPVPEFLEEIAALFRTHEVGKGMQVVVAGGCGGLTINTDKALLSRVIGNLVKNALEAEKPGATITVACRKTPGGTAFTVHNPGAIPEDSRLQVFQRSFSTKGEGRGLGTYSIRLLTTRYLKGSVSFTTGPAGTQFRVELPAK